MRRSSSKAPGQRQLRVGERIRHLIAGIFRNTNLSDPDLTRLELITVTSVDVSPDLKNANVFIIPLRTTNQDDARDDIIVKALNRATSYFRRELGKELELRHVPKLIFRLDTSFDQGMRIDGLLNDERVRADIAKKEDDA